jgi:alpha-tubulin suppressor-like RCC1 family protein
MKNIFLLIIILLFEKTNAQCWQTIAAGIDHNAAIRTDGTLWIWGNNDFGQLGDGSVAEKITPAQVGTDTDWLKVFAGSYTTFAIKIDGTLWAWGRNKNVSLGTGEIVLSNIPVQVGTDTDWDKLASGDDHITALKTNGTLWTWGNNTDSALGSGMAIKSKIYPEQVGTDTNWAIIQAGKHSSVAIKSDGTLWLWGRNPFAEVDKGILQTIITPTQLGTDANWAAVTLREHSIIGIKTNGTLWIWDNNALSEFGNYSTSNIPKPLQIGTDTNWQSLSGVNKNVLALKANNTLWIMKDTPGGDNETLTNLEMVKVGKESDWQCISMLGNHFLALKSDNKLYAFGDSDFGRIGNKAKAPSAVNCTSSGLKSLDTKSHFIMYPNPVGNVLNLNGSNGFKVDRLVVTDLSGKTVIQLKGNIKQIDTYKLQAGMYLLELYGEGNIFRAKFIKK